MRLDLAMALKPGDKVVNVFMDELVISSIDYSISPSKPPVFIALDTRLQKHYLWFDEIYHPDLEDICDEEKSFILWAKEWKQFIGENSRLLKTVYMQGFAMGFEHKRKISHEEAMQK
jgi:hypothetical protein